MTTALYTSQTVVRDWPACAVRDCTAKVNPLSSQWARTRRCKQHETDPNRQPRALGQQTRDDRRQR